MSSFRAKRAGQQIHQEISVMLGREIADPRLANVNVTHVDVSGDLRIAKVYVAPASDDAQENQAMLEALEHARGYFRRQIARALDTRFAPELRFVLDHAIERGERFLQILDQVQEERRAAEQARGTPEEIRGRREKDE